jgi:tetratricopeptide (TPR) repeat protein
MNTSEKVPYSSFFAVGLLTLLMACGADRMRRAQVTTTPRRETPADPAAVGKMMQGVQAAKEGQRDQAVEALRAAIRIDTNLWEARYDLGILLANAGDLAGAERELTLAAKLSPDWQEASIALAEARRRRGEYRLAADGLNDFVRLHTNAIEARMLLVEVLRDSGQIDNAITEAREVLVRKPGDATALAELALAHLSKGEREAAELVAKQALEANPNSAGTHRVMGLLSLAKGDDANAFSEFRKASQADPQDTTSRKNMGVVLLRAGAYARAEEQYREILKVSPDDRGAQLGLAAALRGQTDASRPRKLEEARELLEKVLAADEHDTNAQFNLGVLYADFLKKPSEASPFFTRFLADAPADHPLRAEAERYVSAAAANAPPPAAVSATPAPAPPPPPPPKGATKATR